MYPLPNSRRRRSLAALLTLPLLLAGTAYAVDDASTGSASKAGAADDCARGNVLGTARVRGLHHIPVNAFNENQANIIERYNCSDDDDAADSVGVKRVSTGKYLVRFENNKAKVAAVTTEHSRYKASVMRISADNDPHVVFQVETRSVTKSDDGEFKDSRFHILIG